MKLSATILAAVTLVAPPAIAQPAPRPIKLFTSNADIPALIAKAKANQKASDINSVEPLLTLPPYRVQLEYRTGVTPPTLHHGQSELVYVLKGGCTLVTGGQLTGIKAATNPGATTDVGTAIEGGTPRKLAKGDFVMIPPDTPHQFQAVTGEFIIMSVHLPMPAGKN